MSALADKVHKQEMPYSDMHSMTRIQQPSLHK